MERPSRALRKLPGRLSDEPFAFSKPVKSPEPRKKSTSPKKSATPRKGTSPSRKVATEIKSPRSRSRSKSAGRKKPATNKLEDKKSPARTASNKAKSATPPRSGVVKRVKESVEKFTKSVSPEIENFVRESVSRFENVTNDLVRRSITPNVVTTSTITSRSSMRLREAATNHLKNSQELQWKEEKVVKNHVSGKKHDEKPDSDGKFKVLYSILLVTAVLILTSLTVAANVLCTRDDCRITVPKLEKFLNLKLYFDTYTWLGFTSFLLVFLGAARFIQIRLKKFPYVSLLGIGWLLIALGSIGACHFYFQSIRHLKFLPFLTASLFHSLILILLSANFNSLFGVKIPSFICRISYLTSLVIAGWLAASETHRTVPNLTVYILVGLQAWITADSLIFEPILNKTSSLFLLREVLRPFVLALVPIFISSNNIKVHYACWIGGAILTVSGYALYRSSLFLKGRFLCDPYSYRHMKVGHNECSDGPWKIIRHPDILGRLLSELGVALFTAPSPVGLPLSLLALVTAFLEARTLDSQPVDVSSSRSNRKSLIPYVY